MFTVCPKCALTLAVTAADLRIAQGYVRCGRCLNVFNALARLSEERPAIPPPASAPEAAGTLASPTAPSSAPSATSTSPVPAAHPAPSVADEETGEIEMELDASLIVTSVRPPASLEDTAESPSQAVEEPPAANPTPASAVVPTTAPAALAPAGEAPAPWAPAASAPPAAPAPEIAPGAASAPAPAAASAAAETARPGEARTQSIIVTPAASATDAVPHAEPAATEQTNTEQPPADDAFELRPPRPRAGLAWTLGAGALAIVLALQILNHYRDTLVTVPALRGPLSTLYAALGVKLAPHWNVQAYDVRQLGASVSGSASGEIIVRASVKNTASSAQPLPLLRVTLQDRFGNRIAARDVPPPDYLPSSVASSALLAAGSRVDATMVFVDPGPQAVGFEIDACLRRQSGEVACAHGP